MIFVTVGVQLPFDRLIRAMDDWALARGRRDVIAQVGATAYQARVIEPRAFIDADEYGALAQGAELVVAHAGMGSIITALELGKPIFVLPRLAALGEHRNDHQIATANRMAAQPNVSVAKNEQALVQMLDDFRAPETEVAITGQASATLLAEIAAFIQAPSARGRRIAG